MFGETHLLYTRFCAMFLVKLCVMVSLFTCVVFSSSFAQESLDNLPLPRWATIAANEVNLRTGPGKRYPIEWVLKKKTLPLEITREFEHWRLVREPEGGAGWVHRSMLTSTRYVMVQDDEMVLYANPSEQAAVVARLRKGVLGRVKNCQPQWCRVTVQNYEGWLAKKTLWGVYPSEALE